MTTWTQLRTLNDGTLVREMEYRAAIGDVAGLVAAIDKGGDVNHWKRPFPGRRAVEMAPNDSPLVAAVLNAHVDAARALLIRGANVRTLVVDDRTLLHAVAGEGTDDNMLRLLLHHGADVNALAMIDGRSQTPLDAAAKCSIRVSIQDAKLVILLAVHGATLNDPDYWCTPSLDGVPTFPLKHILPGHGVLGDPPTPAFLKAMGAGEHSEAVAALQLGHIDPSDCVVEFIADTFAAAAATGCQATMKLARQGLSGWSPETHRIHHSGVHAAVSAMLQVSNRLAQTEQPDEPLGTLPPELWLQVLGHVQRSWWWPIMAPLPLAQTPDQVVIEIPAANGTFPDFPIPDSMIDPHAPWHRMSDKKN